MTRTLPTDRYGRVYYGPRTYREAEDVVMSAPDDESRATAERVHDQLVHAGYPGVAARVRRDYLSA